MAVQIQQGDVFLFQTNNDGDIIVEDGLVEMRGSLETSAYLSLFGGNEEDTGLDSSPLNWWANLSEIDPNKHYRSETQNLLRSIPLTSANLRRAEDAAKRDLAWFVEVGAATSIEVEATIPALNTLALNVRIVADGLESDFQFIETWKADIRPQIPLEGLEVVSVSVGSLLLEDGEELLLEDGTSILLESQ